jgi:YHS domain-containing protein
VSTTPVNTNCPVSGKDVEAGFTAAFETKTVGFCCDKCPKEFEKDPKKFAANIKADAAPADKKPADKKADEKKADAKPADKKPDAKPEDKKPADAKAAEKKPDAKPEEPKKLVAINTKCPVSGEDVDEKVVSLFDAKGVGFCCEDCQKKFLKDPAKFKDKIVADAKK